MLPSIWHLYQDQMLSEKLSQFPFSILYYLISPGRCLMPLARQINSHYQQELLNKDTWDYKWQEDLVPKNRVPQWAVPKNLRNLPTLLELNFTILLIIIFVTLLSNTSAENLLLLAKTNLLQLYKKLPFLRTIFHWIRNYHN